MELADTLHWLTSLRNLGSRLGVDRMRMLAARLAHPESCAPVFHVAGTNGKGSTCAMIEAIQRAQGRRTGLYTSPHLMEIGERVQIDRRSATHERIGELAEQLRPHYEAIVQEDKAMAPTFFELITAIALLEFREQHVDVMVLETGLGGRLDATNICQPEVCVITSIGLDHQEYLGASLAAIAGEKAGIIKAGIPCVVGKVPPEAEAVIVARAQEVGAPLYFVRDRFKAGLPLTNLEGAHQRWNAGAALLASELATRLPINQALAQAALLNVTWAGRWEDLTLSDGRKLIIDGSHNEEGVRIVEPLLAQLREPTIIVGALGAHRARPLIEAAARHAAVLILVRPDNERACSVAELKTLVPPSFKGEVRTALVADLFPAAGQCAAPGDPLVVLGSLYLVGEVLARLQGRALPDAGMQDRLLTAKKNVPKVDPAELPQWLIAEDDDYMVFDKPGWLVCHPSKDGPWSSLVGAVKEWKQSEVSYLISRLDRETSGIILIAKHREAASAAQTAMEQRLVSKTYYALLKGILAAPILVDQPLGPDETSAVAVKTAVREGPGTSPSATFFEPILTGGGFTLARVQPHTGRKHQIRAHAQWLGVPVVGDKLYGGDESLYLEFAEFGWTERHAAKLEMGRQALHAAQLDFRSPKLTRIFTAPLAPDMRAFVLQKMGFSAEQLDEALKN